MDKQPIVIFGAGGHGRVILDILLEMREEVLGFLDDDPIKNNTFVDGYPILGGWEYFNTISNVGLALGIGNNKIRREIAENAKLKKITLVSAVHPKAIISKTAKISSGVVVMPGSVINTNVILQEGVVVNTGATIDHDCVIQAYAHIWPGAHLAGTVNVGEMSYIGTGANVIQNIIIGNNTIIGAGATVVNNIEDNVVAVGVPAKKVKEREICRF